MAQAAAHQVFPALPVRQWVLSVPKRLRYFLQRDAAALSAVLRILLRVIEARLRERSGGLGGRLGAVSFVQRFGNALNAYPCGLPPCGRESLSRRSRVARLSGWSIPGAIGVENFSFRSACVPVLAKHVQRSP